MKALTVKAAAAPAAATIMPPTAGPTLRARLKPMELSATAPARSRRGTISPTEACQAGPFIAAPHPIRKVKTSSTQGVIHPAQAKRLRVTDTTSMKTWAASIILRRSKVSASAPAGNDSSMMGRVTEACTSATIPADPIEVIIQDAPTDWIRPPKFDARLAIQTARKIGLFSDASSDGLVD